MGVAAENNIDTRDAARQFEIDIHPIVRQQNDSVDLFALQNLIDDFLKLLVPDTKSPVRNEPLWMGDRNVRECLTDDGNPEVTHLPDEIRLEDAT